MFMKELVKRYEGNPLLTAGDLPGADAIFNAGAVKFNGKYLLLVSVSMPGAPGNGRSIHVAESPDGHQFKIRREVFIGPEQEGPYTEFDYDLCDPRVTKIDGTYYITYPAHRPDVGVCSVWGTTTDFVHFQRRFF